MQPEASTEKGGNVQAAGPDILFKCHHCAASLVVDRAAAGMTLNCQRCGQATTVPNESPSETGSGATSGPERRAQLERCLKENESQRTEITGYINQASIQLHRWKLRLQTLDQRREELRAEMASADRAG